MQQPYCHRRERDRLHGLLEGQAAGGAPPRASAPRWRQIWTASSRSASGRSPRSSSSTSRSRRSAARSARSKKRSAPRKAATARARPASPISASASTSRLPSACRSCRATAPTFSAGSARFSPGVPTSRWPATASCCRRQCSLPRPATCSTNRSGASSTSSPTRSWSVSSRSPGDHLGHPRRRAHRQAAAPGDRPLPLQLGAVGRALDRRGAPPHLARHPAGPPRRRRFWRVPAARSGRNRGGARPQPPHRAEANGALGLMVAAGWSPGSLASARLTPLRRDACSWR